MIKKYFAELLWDFCECFGISLGRFAPHVFGAMSGCKDYKKVEDVHEVVKPPTGHKPNLMMMDEHTSSLIDADAELMSKLDARIKELGSQLKIEPEDK